MDKKYIMFYRGGDMSNKVISTTKNFLEKNAIELSKIIDFEFINLDKINYIKYFEKLKKLPDRIYIWHDEENLINYINENYKNINIIILDKINSYEYIKAKHKYICIIGNKILNEYKESLGCKEFWIINNFKIIKKEINIYDYNLLDEWLKKQYYENEIDAKKN